MSIFVGIDGGGTKTEFKAISEDHKELARITIKEGCKPSYYGVDRAVDVINTGLSQLQAQLTQPIDTIYAGIAGCYTPSPINEPIIESLEKYANKVELSGDLMTNFRAVSTKEHGVAFLAGSGSAIVHWHPNGTTRLDSVCYGAREVVFLLSNRYKQGGLSDEAKELLEDEIGTEFLGESAHFYLTNKIPMESLKALTPDKAKPEAWVELKPVFDIVVNRWAFKGIGRVLRHQELDPTIPTEVVLSGGLWSFDYIRLELIKQLENALGNTITARFDPGRTAVDGAAILASELQK